MAVPQAVTVLRADPRLAEEAAPDAVALRAVLRGPTVAKALRGVPLQTEEVTPAVEAPAIVRAAAALVGEPVLRKVPVATDVAMQASAELVRAYDAAPVTARAAPTGPAAEPLQPQRLTDPVPTSKIAKAAQAATHDSAEPAKPAPPVEVAPKAMRGVARAPAVTSAPRALVSANAVTRAHRAVVPAVKAAANDALVAKAMRGVARALAATSALRDLVSANAVTRAHRAAAPAVKAAANDALVAKAIRGVALAPAVTSAPRALASVNAVTRAHRAVAPAVKAAANDALVAKAMRGVVRAPAAMSTLRNLSPKVMMPSHPNLVLVVKALARVLTNTLRIQAVKSAALVRANTGRIRRRRVRLPCGIRRQLVAARARVGPKGVHLVVINPKVLIAVGRLAEARR